MSLQSIKEVQQRYPIFFIFSDERPFGSNQWVIRLNDEYIKSVGMSYNEFKYFLNNLHIEPIGFLTIGKDGKPTRADLTSTAPHKYYMLLETVPDENDSKSIFMIMYKRYDLLINSNKPLPLTNEQIDELVSIININGALRTTSQTATNALRDTYRTMLKGVELVPQGYNEFKHQFFQAFIQSVVDPGTSIGPHAAEAMGEPVTQMTLKTFHFAGTATNVAFGLSQATETLKCNDTLQQEVFTIYFKNNNLSFDDVYSKRSELIHVRISYLLDKTPTIDLQSEHEKSKWHRIYELTHQRQIPNSKYMIRLTFRPSQLYAFGLTTTRIADLLENYENTPIIAVPSSTNEGFIDIYPLKDKMKDFLVNRFSPSSKSAPKNPRGGRKKLNINFDSSLDRTLTEDQMYIMFLENCVLDELDFVYIQGVEYVTEVNPVTKPVMAVMMDEEKLNPLKMTIEDSMLSSMGKGVSYELNSEYDSYDVIKKYSIDDLLNQIADNKLIILYKALVKKDVSEIDRSVTLNELKKVQTTMIVDSIIKNEDKFFDLHQSLNANYLARMNILTDTIVDALHKFFSIEKFNEQEWTMLTNQQKIDQIKEAQAEGRLASRWIFYYNLMIMKRDGIYYDKVKKLLDLAGIKVVKHYTEDITNTMKLIMDDIYKNISGIRAASKEEVYSRGLVLETIHGRSPHKIISEISSRNLKDKKAKILASKYLQYMEPTEFDRFGNMHYATTINKRLNDKPDEGKRAKFIDLIKRDGIDYTKCYCNNVRQIYQTLGITAVRAYLFRTLYDILKYQNANIDYRHVLMIVDFMTFRGEPTSITYVGVAKQNQGPFTSAAFSHPMQFITNAAATGKKENLSSVSASIIVGTPIKIGTGSAKTKFDPEMINKLKQIKNMRETGTKVDNTALTESIKLNSTIKESTEPIKLPELKPIVPPKKDVQSVINAEKEKIAASSAQKKPVLAGIRPIVPLKPSSVMASQPTAPPPGSAEAKARQMGSEDPSLQKINRPPALTVQAAARYVEPTSNGQITYTQAPINGNMNGSPTRIVPVPGTATAREYAQMPFIPVTRINPSVNLARGIVTPGSKPF